MCSSSAPGFNALEKRLLVYVQLEHKQCPFSMGRHGAHSWLEKHHSYAHPVLAKPVLVLQEQVLLQSKHVVLDKQHLQELELVWVNAQAYWLSKCPKGAVVFSLA